MPPPVLAQTTATSPAQRAQLAADGHLLLSYESTQNQVQAFDLRLAR
ncbi:hypothetical protein [Kribbella qitaiheensis]|nr:hypothetical protein [Kribbella qitaiheensis]